MNIFVGITGASGQIYAGRLLKELTGHGHNVTACFSDASVQVIRSEEQAPSPADVPEVRGNMSHAKGTQEDAGYSLADAPVDQVLDEFFNRHGIAPGGADVVSPDNMSSVYASGSSLADAAIICPCSMSSLACMAAGVTRNLIHRAADVMLKESRPLVIVPRETPLSEIHLKNMLTLKRAGAEIVPAMPAFYHNPQNIEDLAGFVVGKALDVLRIQHNIFTRWKA